MALDDKSIQLSWHCSNSLHFQPGISIKLDYLQVHVDISVARRFLVL